MAKRYVIQHINFVESEPITLTYRAMILIVLMIIAAGGATFAVQNMRMKFMEKRISSLDAEITSLRSNRDRILSEIAKQGEKTSMSKARVNLVPIFEDTEMWSSVLKEITARIPHSLWLLDIHSVDRTDLTSRKGLMISGQAHQPEVITFFVKALGSTACFEQIILTTLEQKNKENEAPMYNFSIEMGISTRKAASVVMGGAQ